MVSIHLIPNLSVVGQIWETRFQPTPLSFPIVLSWGPVKDLTLDQTDHQPCPMGCRSMSWELVKKQSPKSDTRLANGRDVSIGPVLLELPVKSDHKLVRAANRVLMDYLVGIPVGSGGPPILDPNRRSINLLAPQKCTCIPAVGFPNLTGVVPHREIMPPLEFQFQCISIEKQTVIRTAPFLQFCRTQPLNRQIFPRY